MGCRPGNYRRFPGHVVLLSPGARMPPPPLDTQPSALPCTRPLAFGRTAIREQEWPTLYPVPMQPVRCRSLRHATRRRLASPNRHTRSQATPVEDAVVERGQEMSNQLDHAKPVRTPLWTPRAHTEKPCASLQQWPPRTHPTLRSIASAQTPVTDASLVAWTSPDGVDAAHMGLRIRRFATWSSRRAAL